jgi:hypothetical protein
MLKMENKKNSTVLEPSIEESPIGSYGTRWLNWMQDNHKKLVREMKAKNIFLTVARSVDKDAWNYRDLLDRQYEESNPRPHGFEEVRKWEFTREYYTDSAVMRERVLHPYKTP